MDFLWVRSAFRRLFSGKMFGKWISWELAIAWLNACPEKQALVIRELEADLELISQQE